MKNASPAIFTIIRLTKITFIILSTFIFSITCVAKDFHHLLSIDVAVEQVKINKNYIADIELYFESQKTPVVERLYLQMVSSETSVALLQDASDVCQRAFKNTILAMQKKALSLGAIAVVNIHSKFAGEALEDKKQFQCMVGNLVGEVTLVGELVRFRKK